MMGANRSRLSRRIFLFLIVLLGTPMAARCDALEDSARELARKISAILPAGENPYCKMRNASSLNPDELYRIGQALNSGLQRQCVSTSGTTVAVLVTFSENLENFIWTAEISQGNELHAVLLAVPHSAANHTPENSLPLNLTREQFWEGPERPLDVEPMSAPNGDQLVVLLLRDFLVIRNTTANSDTQISLPIEVPKSELREPSGTLSGNEKFIEVWAGQRTCTISLETYNLNSCQDGDRDRPHVIQFRMEGGQLGHPVTPCSKNLSWFMTGTGDDTQPDFLKIVERRNPNEITVSNQLDFTGPVIAIHDAAKFPRVIVRNLSTGKYEAYRLSISCGQ